MLLQLQEQCACHFTSRSGARRSEGNFLGNAGLHDLLLKAGLSRSAQPWARRAPRGAPGSKVGYRKPAAPRLDPWTDPDALHPLPSALQPRMTAPMQWSPGALQGPSLGSGLGSELGSLSEKPLHAPDPEGHRGRRHGSSDASELLLGRASACSQSRQVPIRARGGSSAGGDEVADTASAPARLHVLGDAALGEDAGVMPTTTAPIACTRPGLRLFSSCSHVSGMPISCCAQRCRPSPGASTVVEQLRDCMRGLPLGAEAPACMQAGVSVGGQLCQSELVAQALLDES